MRVSVLVDDIPLYENFKPVHGLSILIEFNGGKVLFNTGPSLEALINNSRLLNVSIEGSLVFISDWKKQHCGALKDLLEHYRVERIYGPPYTGSLTLIKPPEGVLDASKINEEAWFLKSIGPFGMEWYKEVALAVDNKGVVDLFLGCSAYGFEDFIVEASNMGKLRYVIGGLHLTTKDVVGFKILNKLVEKYDIKGIIPLHCTSLQARREINKRWGIFVESGAGLVFDV